MGGGQAADRAIAEEKGVDTFWQINQRGALIAVDDVTYFFYACELRQARERYEAELDRQYNTYKLSCWREQASRDRELVKLSPTDKEAIDRIHEDYDKEIRRAEHIYERYKEQARKRYQKEAEEIRLKYGDLPLKQEIRATSAPQAESGGDKMTKFCKFDETPSWPCRWEGEPTAEDCINCQLFVIKSTLYRLLRRYEEVHGISARKESDRL